MSGPFILLGVVGAGLLLTFFGVVGLLVYLVIHYGPVISRIFEMRPVFLPLQVTPGDTGEQVAFTTQDGLRLEGSYLARRYPERVGLLVFCHEYLSDRWSYFPYLDGLRDIGYDIFAFDFRNHGSSASDPGYAPLQWATDHEVRDLRAALAYLRTRPDHDPAGFGLFGVSRGGSTALVAAAEASDVWGVVTDGAFPTHGTMTAYILRWAEIYVASKQLLAALPLWVYSFLCWESRLRSQRRLKCRFADIETAVRRVSPRPWLLIHGERDAYIGPEIARSLFALAREPKEMWLVHDAKHNRCRECEPDAYAARVIAFLGRYAPRRPVEAPMLQDSGVAISAYVSEPRRAMTTSNHTPPVTLSATS